MDKEPTDIGNIDERKLSKFEFNDGTQKQDRGSNIMSNLTTITGLGLSNFRSKIASPLTSTMTKASHFCQSINQHEDSLSR